MHRSRWICKVFDFSFFKIHNTTRSATLRKSDKICSFWMNVLFKIVGSHNAMLFFNGKDSYATTLDANSTISDIECCQFLKTTLFSAPFGDWFQTLKAQCLFENQDFFRTLRLIYSHFHISSRSHFHISSLVLFACLRIFQIWLFHSKLAFIRTFRIFFLLITTTLFAFFFHPHFSWFFQMNRSHFSSFWYILSCRTFRHLGVSFIRTLAGIFFSIHMRIFFSPKSVTIMCND